MLRDRHVECWALLLPPEEGPGSSATAGEEGASSSPKPIEHFLVEHSTRRVLYVADGFAFRSPMWNEERFVGTKLLSRTPFRLAVLSRLASYVTREGIDVRALLDYATGFSKMNNRSRFELDVWEGERTFDRTFKPSAVADRKRVDYLYPAVADEAAARTKYLSALAELAATAREHDARVTIGLQHTAVTHSKLASEFAR